MTSKFPKKKKCKDDIPLIYLFIFNQMVKKYGRKDKILSYKAVLEVWKRNVYNVPKKYYSHFIEEMCEMGLLKQVSFGKRFKQYGMNGYSKRKCLDKLGDFFLW